LGVLFGCFRGAVEAKKVLLEAKIRIIREIQKIKCEIRKFND